MNKGIRHWIVYMYTFPNNKKYIGKTNRSLTARQGAEFKHYKRCTLLWGAIQKYGYTSITVDILFEGDVTADKASEMEILYIEKYKTNANKYKNPAYGYNLTAGGDGVTDWVPSPERLDQLRAQMAQFHKNRIGTHHSAETREKQRLAKLGKKRGPMSEEVKRKIGLAISNANKSPESRMRRSNSKKKRIHIYYKYIGKGVTLESVEAAAAAFRVGTSTISRWCRGTRPAPSGCIFSYYIPPTTTKREDYTN